MPKEYEAKFLNIDVDAVKRILRKNGAKKIHDPIKFYRVIFKRCEEAGDKPGFVRIRDEGKHVTMTTKVFDNAKFPQEHEVTIGDTFEKGVDFLRSIGLDEKSYQETIREKWSHPLAHEITFDIIPGLPIYMEIDCTDESKLNKLVSLLNLDKKNMHYGSYDKTFTEYYGIPSNTIIHKTPKLTFHNIKNEITPKQNTDMFAEIADLNRTMNLSRMGSYYKAYTRRVYDKFIYTEPASTRKTNTTRKHRRSRKKTRKKKGNTRPTTQRRRKRRKSV